MSAGSSLAQQLLSKLGELKQARKQSNEELQLAQQTLMQEKRTTQSLRESVHTLKVRDVREWICNFIDYLHLSTAP